jgi:GT2 family glycosyltransferase
MTHRFAVVIAAHREYPTLEHCVRGFQALVLEPADLIFVDNGSGGTLGNWIATIAPKATLISLHDNRLFCGGYNAGIKFALGRNYDYVLIVNADTEVVNPTFVASLIDTMDRHPQAAFVGPLVYYRSTRVVQTTCQVFPNLMQRLLVWLPFRLFPRLVSRQSLNEHEVDFLNGVCVLCRASALREFGLMDESFGAYVEDADWAWRARSTGWLSLFTPVPSIIHHEEPNGYEHYSFKNYLLRVNTVRWFLKAKKSRQASFYAMASRSFALLRTLRSQDPRERESYRVYALNLKYAYQRLLSKQKSVDEGSNSSSTTQLPMAPSRNSE